MNSESIALEIKRMIKFDGDGPVKALCDLAIGDLFVIRGLRIIDGKNGLFVSMPRWQGKEGKWFDLVMPQSKQVRETVQNLLLNAYETAACPSNAHEQA